MTTSQDTTKVETQGLQGFGSRPEPSAQTPSEDERMKVLQVIDDALDAQGCLPRLKDNGIEAPVEDPRMKDPKIRQAVMDVLDAIQAANQRAIAKIDQELAVAAIQLEDLNGLIDSALAEPGSITASDISRQAIELQGKVSERDFAALFQRIQELANQQPEPPNPKDVTIWVDHLVYVSINMKPWEHMEPAAAALYEAGGKLLESDAGSVEGKLGHLLMLDALIASPEATQHVVRHLRALLVASDERLAMFTR